MDIQQLVICKILETRDLSPVVEAGVTDVFFPDTEARKLYRTIRDHSTQYGSVPTIKQIKRDFPNYPLIQVEDEYPYLIDELRDMRTRAVLEDALQRGVEGWDDRETQHVIDVLTQALTQIGQEVSATRDVDLAQTGPGRLEQYDAYSEQGELRGVPSGFKPLDEALLGFQPGNLITFIGPPKSGKSTLMLLAAKNAWLQGYKVVYLGFEMTNTEQAERWDSILAGVNHTRLRSGTLTDEEWVKLESHLNNLDGQPPFIVSTDSHSALTLSGARAKADKFKPDALYVDGAYMMEDESGEAKGTPRALTNLTRGFKMLADHLGIPILLATQALSYKIGKGGLTSDTIGYSSSFAQDSTAIIGIMPTDDPGVAKVNIVDARNAPRLEFFIRRDWNNGDFSVLDEDPFKGLDGAYEDSFA